MRIRVKLIAAKDAETGELGLVVKGIQPIDGEVNSALEGMLIAHDLIEHVNGVKRIGSIDDELEALGAIWYVRGQHDDLSRDHRGSANTVYENIAGDITRMFLDYFYGVPVDTTPLRTCKHDCDEHFKQILRCAERSYLGEFDDDEKCEARRRWPAYAEVCLPRMRVGYNKAKRKWDKLGHHAANNAFWAIAESINTAHANHPEFEGQEFKLNYDSNTRYATCEEVL